jgi:transposase InsO family protein
VKFIAPLKGSRNAEEYYRMLDGVVVDDSKLFTRKLRQWEDFYNFDRPHGALGGKTPSERLREKVGGSSVSGQRRLHS